MAGASHALLSAEVEGGGGGLGRTTDTAAILDTTSSGPPPLLAGVTGRDADTEGSEGGAREVGDRVRVAGARRGRVLREA